MIKVIDDIGEWSEGKHNKYEVWVKTQDGRGRLIATFENLVDVTRVVNAIRSLDDIVDDLQLQIIGLESDNKNLQTELDLENK